MTRRTAPYHHGDLRRALIQEASAVIEDAGPTALSLRDLARRLGVSPAAPHHHFESREHLLAAVAEAAFEGLISEIGEAVRGASPSGRLRAVATHYLAFATSHPARYRAMFLPELADKDRFRSLHATGGRALELLAALLAGSASGRAPAHALLTRAIAFWSALHGFAMLVNAGFLEEERAAGQLPAIEAALIRSFAGAPGRSARRPASSKPRSSPTSPAV